MSKLSALVVTLAVHLATGHVALWNTPNHLHPVQGLYVKPSVDGSTGDLYVAATEDNGVKTQWLTDQPINFLQSAAAHQAVMPFSYTSSLSAASLPHDESVVTTHKRAVMTSPAMKYTYALPEASNEGNTIPYAYAAISANPAPIDGAKQCTGTAAIPTSAYPQYSPYQYYYPQIVSAVANAILKEVGVSDDTDSSVMPQAQAAPMWPYPYPVQYVMVDPAAWAQSQATSTAANSTPTTTPANSSIAASNEDV